MNQSLTTWLAPCSVASADEVVRALESGAEIFVISPAATGFACGAKLGVDTRHGKPCTEGTLARRDGAWKTWLD